MAKKRMKVLGKEKPPPKPGAVATRKVKKLPKKTKQPG
jgi:hypothetical protein